ncbi:PAS domain-containing protein [Fontisphaera persica]|uniref:PAS domain-containing protein n=1 Tax=Fontisphaera persica TaxID=2974023 RepID=UPI0024C02458|nr:PAS domain-containing protein [Fontisphaera persica]WCJ60205.1 PAS domain-containing protein [Fontisphaera persica]
MSANAASVHGRVFVAHRNAQTARQACQELKAAGYLSDWATTGQETLTALHISPADLLLLDPFLTSPASPEVVRQCKNCFPQAHGLLLITLEEQPLSREGAQGMEAGADGCLAGPLSGSAFLAQVHAFHRFHQQGEDWKKRAADSELQKQHLAQRMEASQHELAHLQTIHHQAEISLQQARAEELHNRSLARMLEGLLDAIPDVIGVLDSQRRVVRYNAAGYQFLGLTPDQAKGRPCYELLGRLKPCAVCATAESLRTRAPAQLEKYVPEMDCWLDVRSYPVLDDHGEILYVIEHLRDITHQKKAEQALQESEERLRLALATANEGLYDLNIATGETIVSPEYARMLGYEPKEFHETNAAWRERLHPDDRDLVYGVYLDYISGQRPDYRVEFRQRAKSGEWKWILSVGKIVQFDSQGRPLRMIGTHTDITAQRDAEATQKKLREQLTQAQKLDSIGRLAGGVAHDFNNMLQAILGNIAIALEDLPPDSPVRENLREVEQAAQRSAELTRQLLAFARKQNVSPMVLDLNQTVTDMLKMLRRLIGENIQLDWKPGANLWHVFMDPGQLDQILANLCVNARDAISAHGLITIETANASLDTTYAATHAEVAPGDYVMLAVTDNGSGMDARTKAHLFEPFFTTKEPGKGTGLGLATVFGIVKQNRGLINVYSEPGQGSTFKVYLPRASQNAAPEIASPPATLRRGNETILVVEDEAQVLALAERILSHHGYTVLSAHTPQEALRIAEQHPGTIHLLITDVIMPGMNGRELYLQLLPNRPNLRCLYMSGYTANVIAHQGIVDPGVNFIEKPFTIQSLLGKLNLALEAPAASQ